MIQLKLAFHNLIKNKNQSFPFIFSNSVWIAMTYIFLSLLYNTNLKSNSFGTVTVLFLQFGLIFTVLVGTLSTFYAEKLLSKQRVEELALYSMLGLTKGNLRQIVFIENTLFYLISTFIGSIIGMIFSKLAFMSLKSLLSLKSLSQSFSLTPLTHVITIFAIIFLAIIILEFWNLKKVSPIDLWAKSAQPEKEPKSHALLATLGIICLSIGYLISLMVKPTASAFVNFIVAILFVVIGSYLVFITTSITLLKGLKRNKNYYYKPRHFISVSNMLYRMKENGASLASISLLCTSILVALISSVSLVSGQKNLINSWSPRDIQIVSPSPITQSSRQEIKRLSKKYDIEIINKQTLAVTKPVNGIISGNSFKSQFNNKTEFALSSLDIKQYNNIQKTNYSIQNNEILMYAPGTNYSENTIFIRGKKYKVKQIYNFDGSFNYAHSIYKPIFIIAANKNIVKQINPQSYVYSQGFNTRGTKSNQKKFANSIQKNLKLDPAFFTSKYVMEDLLSSMFGGLLFTGILISLVMICATTLIIYYKQISEGYSDKHNYQIMSKIGLSNKDIKKTIKSQVLTVFMLPIIGSLINLAFAFPAIKNILKIFSMYDLNILITVSLITTIVLIICYILIYLATTNVYKNIVSQK